MLICEVVVSLAGCLDFRFVVDGNGRGQVVDGTGYIVGGVLVSGYGRESFLSGGQGGKSLVLNVCLLSVGQSVVCGASCLDVGLSVEGDGLGKGVDRLGDFVSGCLVGEDSCEGVLSVGKSGDGLFLYICLLGVGKSVVSGTSCFYVGLIVESDGLGKGVDRLGHVVGCSLVGLSLSESVLRGFQSVFGLFTYERLLAVGQSVVSIGGCVDLLGVGDGDVLGRQSVDELGCRVCGCLVGGQLGDRFLSGGQGGESLVLYIFLLVVGKIVVSGTSLFYCILIVQSDGLGQGVDLLGDFVGFCLVVEDNCEGVLSVGEFIEGLFCNKSLLGVGQSVVSGTSCFYVGLIV